MNMKKTYIKPYIEIYEVDEMSSMVLLSPGGDDIGEGGDLPIMPISGRSRNKSALSTTFSDNSSDEENESSGLSSNSPF